MFALLAGKACIGNRDRMIAAPPIRLSMRVSKYGHKISAYRGFSPNSTGKKTTTMWPNNCEAALARFWACLEGFFLEKADRV
jgi:hypothetical protein